MYTSYKKAVGKCSSQLFLVEKHRMKVTFIFFPRHFISKLVWMRWECQSVCFPVPDGLKKGLGEGWAHTCFAWVQVWAKIMTSTGLIMPVSVRGPIIWQAQELHPSNLPSLNPRTFPIWCSLYQMKSNKKPMAVVNARTMDAFSHQMPKGLWEWLRSSTPSTCI